MRRAPAAGAAAAALSLLLAGCAPTVTAARLDAQVGPTFARLYAVRQQRLGQAVPARGPSGTARCRRGGGTAAPGTAPVGTGTAGAGDDWACVVDYPFPDGHVQPITYDLTVAPTGCYVADGPTAVVGAQTLTTPDGAAVVNPLFAFDGCLRP